MFEQLRAWRAATAKEQGVPAYVIFHDATLRQIAAECPTTLAELGTVSGVGEHKLAKYGQQVLDTLTALMAQVHEETAGPAARHFVMLRDGAMAAGCLFDSALVAETFLAGVEGLLRVNTERQRTGG